jgi:hypothetical protein
MGERRDVSTCSAEHGLFDTYHRQVRTAASLVLHFKVAGSSARRTAPRSRLPTRANLPTATMPGKTASFTLQPIDTATAAMRSLVGNLAGTLATLVPARVFHGPIVAFDQRAS